jgi:hypothetical protein
VPESEVGVMKPWQEMRTPEQNDLLQPACRDLSKCLTWKGYKLSPDEWRWLICAAVLGQKIVPGLTGGIVALGGSSKKLTKQQATDAITMAFEIGDQPWTYDPSLTQQVRWCDVICLARGIRPEERAA